ncbi:WXG100-like domain-containing protein [Nocardia amamiensis]|uniref:WXG100-like domain-containing protein n=1 Tax=Nocardia amamiensis TaxID=404578 RepID=UPI000A3FE0FB|nr:hypothetical protein [Nocardia amamiensis]
MTLYLPDGLQWLAWVAGTTWPEGDEDAAWAASEAWRTASKELEALLAAIDQAKQTTVSAYPQGEGGAAMGARYDILRTGDHSVEALAKLMSTVGDSAFDMGSEIQATKLTVIVTLAWLALEILWAWLFPPTAPAVEAAAVTTTRSFLKVFEDFVQKIITNIAARLGAPTVKRHFWSRAVHLRPVLPTAKGYGVYGARAIEAAAITGTINGAVQVGQLGAGKRRHFNGGEFGLSIFAGAAGVIPGREFGRYLGKGIDKVAGKNLDNVFGRVGRGVVIGGASGAVGTAFGNVAAGAVTGDWSSFSSGAGWVGGIARGGIVGGARGGFALGTPIPPGRGDIRSYVWMPKPSTGNTGRPPVHDGSSTSSSGTRPASTTTGNGETGSGARANALSGRSSTTASTVAGPTGTPAPQPNGSRPNSESGNANAASTAAGPTATPAPQPNGSRPNSESGNANAASTAAGPTATPAPQPNGSRPNSESGNANAASTAAGPTATPAPQPSSSRPDSESGNANVASTAAGPTGTPAGPAPHPNGSPPGESRPIAEISNGNAGSTHSVRGDGASSAGSSGHTVSHDPTSGHSGSGQTARPAAPDNVSAGAGQTVNHDTASTFSNSTSSSTGAGSGYSTGSGAGESGHATGRPPTSWESSIDGGRSTESPQPANTGTGPTVGTPLPPAHATSGTTPPAAPTASGHTPPAPPTASGHTAPAAPTASGHTPPGPTGAGPRPSGPQVTGSSGTHGNPIATSADEPFLGEGKDVRGKPRPKQWPSVEPLPGPFKPPSGGADQPDDWLPAAPKAGAQAAGGPEDVDVPFTL